VSSKHGREYFDITNGLKARQGRGVVVQILVDHGDLTQRAQAAGRSRADVIPALKEGLKALGSGSSGPVLAP